VCRWRDLGAVLGARGCFAPFAGRPVVGLRGVRTKLGRAAARHRAAPRRCRVRYFGAMANCLVTGVAGFIGSSIVRALLTGGRRVRGVDNFATGKWENVAGV